MIAQWLEDHLDEILERYVTIRIERYHDTYPAELLRERTRPVFVQLVRALRKQAPWEPFVRGIVESILNAGGSNVSIVAEATYVAQLSVTEIMETHQIADRTAWRVAIAEELLEAGKHVAHCIDEHLSRNVEKLREEKEQRELLQQQVIEAQQAAIRELSTPIIPVLEGIIVMPLIGTIDTMRARDITQVLLEGIGVHRAEVVIIDVTGIAAIDTAVASHLTGAIAAARLLGTHPIVSGVSGAAAQTIVEMGIDWSGIETVANLQTGLTRALHQAGLRIVAAGGFTTEARRHGG